MGDPARKFADTRIQSEVRNVCPYGSGHKECKCIESTQRDKRGRVEVYRVRDSGAEDKRESSAHGQDVRSKVRHPDGRARRMEQHV